MNDPLRIPADQGRAGQAGSVQPGSGGQAYGRTGAPVQGPSFAEALQQASELTFSNHALKRLEKRQISLGDDGLARLAQAVEKAEQRGGQESLVLMDDLAFIVNVRERRIVTAMDMSQRGEGVFTQIDSVVVANPANAETPSRPRLDKSA